MHQASDQASVAATVTRRSFVEGTAALTFAFALGGVARVPEALGAIPGAKINAWVTIGTDNTVTILCPAAEMGQGTLTSLPLILAEELDADWSKVRIVRAPPIDKLYGNPGFGGIMYTAASNAVRSYFTPLRTFGAQVRRVLLENAARKWGVPVEELATEPSVVVHAKSG